MKKTPVKQRLIGLTDKAHDIIIRGAKRDGTSKSAWVESVILQQEMNLTEAVLLLESRRKPGSVSAE